MPVFFIQSKQISGNFLYLTDLLAKHIGGALRYQAGERIFVVDEQKVGYVVQLLNVTPRKILGKILEEKRQGPTSWLSITLGQAILKAKKMDWILQKATELGVSRIIPLVTERTIVTLRAERIDNQQRRWGEILKEAAQQSGRWDIPELDPPTDFMRLAERGPNFTLSLIPWEGECEKNFKNTLRETLHSKPLPQKILVLIGPEGGFSQQEIEIARKHRIIPVSLGWRILRAETACLATLAMLQYELGDMGSECT
jgi:16S rRNA (uracil1498-N3)-methyltransferase